MVTIKVLRKDIAKSKVNKKRGTTTNYSIVTSMEENQQYGNVEYGENISIKSEADNDHDHDNDDDDLVCTKNLAERSSILKIKSFMTEKDAILRFIPGQRGKQLLLYKNFTFAKNNVCGNATYWNCRSRRLGMKPCKARITTFEQPNGLHKVCLTKPQHNHEPSPRILKKIEKI
ncbi:uncharacterized protein LOC119677744 [Teleopsis dalmanni]|uniref:uncharacterized protein LOC119677744 n=1 Tax=Teleopsis dalmanni TaxID=139649 RepID=UPI0018CEFC29|nr:uncharacterized protein LOC119677744 [Teleopsis dalmanni]